MYRCFLIQLNFFGSLMSVIAVGGRNLETFASRAMSCEDARKLKRFQLDNSLLGSELLTTSIQCAQICSQNKLCRSFNFCGNRVCELHREDIFSTIQGEKLLLNDESCFYIGMSKSVAPACMRKGQMVNIQTDSASGFCEIVSKRVDKQWSEWQTDTIDNESEYKIVRKRDVVLDSAHGGFEHGAPEEVTTWLKFVKERKSWTQARDNCMALGGHLFHSIDGTVGQLQFLYTRNFMESSWIGIYKLYSSLLLMGKS